MDSGKLLKYIGWKCNALAINTIEYEFYPYKVLICDIEEYNRKMHLRKTIRCLTFEGAILDLKFQ